MEDIEVPEEERTEKLKQESGGDPQTPAIPEEVSDADAVEQAQPLRKVADDDPVTRWDVPEADALEQARSADGEGSEDEER